MRLKLIFLAAQTLLMTACATLAPIDRKHYGDWEKDIGYAQVVKVGNTLYISGLTSEKTTFDEQLDDIYQNITKILADYQLTTAAIVKETIYTQDMEALKAAISKRKAHYPNSAYPSATWVEVNRLFNTHHQLEIEVMAIKQ